MEWVTCQKISADVAVKVPLSQCLTCGDCHEAFNAWLQSLPKLPKVNAEEMLEKKKRKKGFCPKVKELVYCNASKTYCHYNTVCADKHPGTKLAIFLEEKNMFIIKKKNGSYLDSKVNRIANVPLDAEVVQVFEAEKRLVVTHTLVPVSKEGTVAIPKLPQGVSETMKVVCLDQEKNPHEMTVKDFVTDALAGNTSSAIIVKAVYQPAVTFKLEPLTGGKKKKSSPAANKPTAPKKEG